MTVTTPNGWAVVPDYGDPALGTLGAVAGRGNVRAGDVAAVLTAFCEDFAREVEPDNAELSVRVEEVAALRASERPSLPVSMASERATNPFLRTDAPAVVEWCRQQPGHPADRTARFAAVRSAKDAFRA
mgnify:CR=1 FL=1